MKKITIGTRASKLAMIQTHQVVEQLRQQQPGLVINIEQIRTTGDHLTDMPLSQIGGDGVFVTEIERALHERRIDLAVHSLKDLPTAQPEGLRLLILGPRADVRDVLVSNNPAFHSLENNPNSSVGARFIAPPEFGDLDNNRRSRVGARFIAPRFIAPPEFGGGVTQEQQPAPRIGTGSLRRIAQIRALWPDAQILPIRGNVDTRLRKLAANDYDGIVLAAAGLHRLDILERLAGRVTYFPLALMMPAPGQGALAIEMRAEPQICELLAPLNDPIVQATTSAERMFMRHLGAGCYLPVAAYAEVNDGLFTLLGLVISLDGQRQVRVQQSMPWSANTSLEHAQQLGIALAEQALARGAGEIIGKINALREQEHQHA